MIYETAKNNFINSSLFDIILFIIGGIVGFSVKRYLIGFQITYQAFVNAAIVFRGSFIEALRLLNINDPNAENWQITIDILESEIEKHAIAAATFEFYLRKGKRKKFKKAWKEYAGKDYPEILLYDDLIEYSSANNPTNEPKKRQCARCKINKLLKFAKP